MKIHLAAVTLLFTAGSAWAQIGNLSDADVSDKSSTTDPARAVQGMDDSWLAFRIPALDGTRSPCCWKGDWKQFGQTGCHLESTQSGYGSTSDLPLTESLFVYARVDSGKVVSMRVVGDQCPVYGDGAKVEWLGAVEESAGLDWLESTARSGAKDSVRHSALYAMALHRSDAVNQRLTTLARDRDSDLNRESIFWLGEARGPDGLESLERLLTELPKGETRREINFAIAQSGTPAALDLLTEISRTDADPEQRSGALFWLAEEFPDEAKVLLQESLILEKDSRVLEQTVFAISQLPQGMSGPMLLDLARDSEAPRQVRRQALFWLAQSDDEDAIAQLTALLTQ